MILWLVLGAIVLGLLKALGESLVPPQHRFGYALTMYCIIGVCVVTAGALIFQLPPWTPPRDVGSYDTHSSRAGLIGSLIIWAISVGPQKTGVAVMAFGLIFFWPLLRDRIQQARQSPLP